MLGSKDGWVDEFSKLGVKDWADEFGDQLAQGSLGDGTSSEWVDSYDRYVTLQEILKPPHSRVQFQRGSSSLGFIDMGCPPQINHMPILL